MWGDSFGEAKRSTRRASWLERQAADRGTDVSKLNQTACHFSGYKKKRWVFIIHTTVAVRIMNGIKIIPLFHCHHHPIDRNKIRYSDCWFRPYKSQWPYSDHDTYRYIDSSLLKGLATCFVGVSSEMGGDHSDHEKMSGVKIIPLFYCHHHPIDRNNIRYSDCWFLPYKSQWPYSDRDSDRYSDCWLLPYKPQWLRKL